jgi:hypothetical protein
MELKQFIADALVEIVEGVRNAKTTIGDDNIFNPSPRMGTVTNEGGSSYITHSHKVCTFVDFDIAVTVTEGTGTKGGIGVFAGAIGLGSQGQSNESNSTVSRIRFQVPVILS